MENSGQIFSLWVGKNSQQLAHHFYALQAEQFFNEEQDPIQHANLWKLYDKQGEKKRPYFLTFDTQISHLNHLRQANHTKIIKQMQKQTLQMEQQYFPMEYKQNQQNDEFKVQQEKDSYLYKRWQASESNYVIVDKNFVQNCDSYDFWKETYKMGEYLYEDKIRKQLEQFDYMKCFTVTSDRERVGFTHSIVQYLQDECPKKNILYFDINGNGDGSTQDHNKNKKQIYSVNNLTALAEIGPMVSTYVSLSTALAKFKYFQTENPFVHLAPVLSCMLTPFILKNASLNQYMCSLIHNPSRNIFDVAYTLPIIDKKLNLSPNTNIFEYLSSRQKYQKLLQSRQQQDLKNNEHMKKQQKKLQQSDEQKEDQNNYENKINFTSDYLKLSQYNHSKDNHHQSSYHQAMKKNKQKMQNLSNGVLCQSYILKGHVHKFKQLFSTKSQHVQLKYLQGIFCNYENQAKYQKSYQKVYGEDIVQNFPFHTVMFQHEQFSSYLNELGNIKDKKVKHEMHQEWKEAIFQQASLYKEKPDESDSD